MDEGATADVATVTTEAAMATTTAKTVPTVTTTTTATAANLLQERMPAALALAFIICVQITVFFSNRQDSLMDNSRSL